MLIPHRQDLPLERAFSCPLDLYVNHLHCGRRGGGNIGIGIDTREFAAEGCIFRLTASTTRAALTRDGFGDSQTTRRFAPNHGKQFIMSLLHEAQVE